MSDSSFCEWTDVGGAIDMKLYNKPGSEDSGVDKPINLAAPKVVFIILQNVLKMIFRT